MFYTDLLNKKDLIKFLKSQDIDASNKDSREKLAKKAQQILKNRKKELRDSYNSDTNSKTNLKTNSKLSINKTETKGARMYECVSPTGNTQLVKSQNLGKHSKNLCNRSSTTTRPKSGCSFGPKKGKQCIQCVFDKNGRMPTKCKGCPSGKNVFYCS